MDFHGYDPGTVGYAQDLSIPYMQIDSTWKIPVYNFSSGTANVWGSWNGNIAQDIFFGRPWDGFYHAIIPKSERLTAPRGYRVEIALTDAGRNLYQSFYDTGFSPCARYANDTRILWNYVPMVIDPGSFTNLAVRGMEQTPGNGHSFKFMVRPWFRSLSDVRKANLASSWEFVHDWDGSAMKSSETVAGSSAVSGNYSNWIEVKRVTKPVAFFELLQSNNNGTNTNITDPTMIEVGMGEAGSEVTVLRYSQPIEMDGHVHTSRWTPKACQIPAGERVSWRYVTTQSSHPTFDYNIRLWYV